MGQYRTCRWSLLALVAICLVLVSHGTVVQGDEEIKNGQVEVRETTTTDRPSMQATGGNGGQEQHKEQHEEEEHKHRQHNLIGMLLSPIRATFARARRMLSSRLGGARDLVVSGFDELQTRAFKIFMSTYNKNYSPEELPRRMKLFFERRQLIEQSLRDFASGTLPFVMRENGFLDWDEAEIKQLARATPPASLDEMTDEEREAALAASDEITNQHQKLELKSATSDGTGSGEDYIEWSSTSGGGGGGGGGQGDQDGREGGEPAWGVSRSFYGETNLTVRATERIPAQKDWRASGCVARPVNQLKCGACYAVATVGALETQRCINRVASSPVLSPQQVVDCSRAYKNYGCDGGWPTRVLSYLQDTRVIARESCYPFVRRANTCRLRQVLSSLSSSAASTCSVAASSTDAPQLRYKVLNNERDILYHVAKTGPVITVMRATDKFLYYGKGIFDDPKCTRLRDDVDHAIVIVGYGRENNMDYWLIKNSWGTTDWGEGGYGKYKRGTNACSIGHWGWVITG